MRVIVVASGELDERDARWLVSADLLIAADGGASSLDRIGRRPDRLIGDLDSVPEELVERLEAAGTRVERHPTDKDASDTELALEAAIAAGGTEIVLLGALGGARLDHEVANLLLITDPGLEGVDVRLTRGGTTVRGLRGGGRRLVLHEAEGELVSLLPVGGDAKGVTTTGLRWSLTDAGLRMGRSRGLSNELVAATASVSIERGTLLVVQTAKQGAST
jgi:thiamine pyrophosphokinase